MQPNLTATTNNRLSALQADVNSLPSGGGLEVLRSSLVDLVEKVNAFVDDIDRLNGVKAPEKTPIKNRRSYYTN